MSDIAPAGSSEVSSSTNLAELTIAGLFRALSRVELAIRACDPTFTVTASRTRMNDDLVELTVLEQQICHELAARRRSFRYAFGPAAGGLMP